MGWWIWRPARVLRVNPLCPAKSGQTHAHHGGAASVARFSARHDITDAGIWTDALVLMAFGQLLARLGVLQGRRVRAVSQPAASQHVPADPARTGRRLARTSYGGIPNA